MSFEPRYQGLAQSPSFYYEGQAEPAAQSSEPDNIPLIATIIVVVGVVFLFVARAFLADKYVTGSVLTVHPDRNADIPMIQNITHTVQTITPTG